MAMLIIFKLLLSPAPNTKNFSVFSSIGKGMDWKGGDIKECCMRHSKMQYHVANDDDEDGDNRNHNI